MAKIDRRTVGDDLVLRARTEADALAGLYELYYERIFRFCVHRLFSKEAAEDVTSTVFLEVARKIRTFTGRTVPRPSPLSPAFLMPRLFAIEESFGSCW